MKIVKTGKEGCELNFQGIAGLEVFSFLAERSVNLVVGAFES